MAETRNDRLAALYDVTRRLATVHETDEILSLIVSEATRLLGADAALLRLVEGDELILRAQTGTAAPRFRHALKIGESLTGLVFTGAEPVLVEDLQEDTRYDPTHKQAALEYGFHGFVGIPLRAHGHTIGVLNLFTKRRRRFTADEVSLLSVFGDQASLAIDKDRLLREARERATRLRVLVRLNQVVFSSLNTNEVLGAIARAAADLMSAPMVSIWSANEAEQTLELRAMSLDEALSTHPDLRRRFGSGAVGWVASHRRALDVPDISADSRVHAQDWLRAQDFRSLFCVPIVFRDQLVGVLQLFGRKPFRLEADERDLLDSFVAQVALAMRNAGLYDELRVAHDRLERRTRDLDMLTRISEMLQACVAEDEAYAVVGRFMGQCFPEEAGGVFITSQSRDLVEAQAVWGAFPAEESSVFKPEDCWALRRGRPHRVEGAAAGLRCRHLPTPAPLESLCIPMMAQGESLGLLYFSGPPEAKAASGWIQTREAFAMAVADHLSLAAANLRLRDTLRNQSIRDPLTGLFNRRYMEETLERELKRSERTGNPLSVIMLDLDHFKEFNDTFGHEAGDVLLRELGQLLKTGVRQSDVACRYGGEEFVLVLPDAAAVHTGERAEQLRSDVKRLHVTYRGQAIGSVTVSLGVAVFPDNGANAPDLVTAADAALYRAKNAGRDQVMFAK